MDSEDFRCKYVQENLFLYFAIFSLTGLSNFKNLSLCLVKKKQKSEDYEERVFWLELIIA